MQLTKFSLYTKRVQRYLCQDNSLWFQQIKAKCGDHVPCCLISLVISVGLFLDSLKHLKYDIFKLIGNGTFIYVVEDNWLFHIPSIRMPIFLNTTNRIILVFNLLSNGYWDKDNLLFFFAPFSLIKYQRLTFLPAHMMMNGHGK